MIQDFVSLFLKCDTEKNKYPLSYILTRIRDIYFSVTDRRQLIMADNYSRLLAKKCITPGWRVRDSIDDYALKMRGIKRKELFMGELSARKYK